MSKRINQMHHDYMIRYMVTQLLHAGYNKIRADIPGYKKPYPVDLSQDQLPDLTAEKNKQLVLVEVETDDSIEEDHTKTEWTALYQYVLEKHGIFIFVGPGISRNKFQKRARQLGISRFQFVGF